MPFAFSDEFKLWLASAPDDGGAPIDCLQIYHYKWGNIFLARWDSALTLRLEDSGYYVFQPADFVIEQLPVEPGTGQSIRAAINSLDGQIYQQIKNLTATERLSPIIIWYRLFLSNRLDVSLIVPPPRLEVAAAVCNRDVVSLELNSSILPNLRSGKYYYLKDFPALKEL